MTIVQPELFPLSAKEWLAHMRAVLAEIRERKGTRR